MTTKHSTTYLRQWALILIGVSLVSWSLLTATLNKNMRAAGSLMGGVVLVVGLRPEKPRENKN